MNKEKTLQEQLKTEIRKVREDLSFVKFKSLFSEDATEKGLANLQGDLGKVLVLLEALKLPELKFPDDVIRKKSIGAQQGDLVQIRPCYKGCPEKTFVGFFIGDLPVGVGLQLRNGKLGIEFDYNPAIFVPELGRVVMGYESWWGQINSPEELKAITDVDIQNVWYVKALKEMAEKKATQDEKKDI